MGDDATRNKQAAYTAMAEGLRSRAEAATLLKQLDADPEGDMPTWFVNFQAEQRQRNKDAAQAEREQKRARVEQQRATRALKVDAVFRDAVASARLLNRGVTPYAPLTAIPLKPTEDRDTPFEAPTPQLSGPPGFPATTQAANSLQVPDLQALLAAYNLSTVGTKRELIDRFLKFHAVN
jgi:hypothetical protein